MKSQNQEKPFILSDRNINDLIIQKRLKGHGTNTEPFIIEDTFSEKVLVLKNLSGGVVVRNLKNKSIRLYKCENIKIEKCSISYLSMTYCKGLTIIDSLIVTAWLLYSRENVFSNTAMTRETLNEITSNVHENRVMKIERFTIPLVIFGLAISFLTPHLYQNSSDVQIVTERLLTWGIAPFAYILFGLIYIFSIRNSHHKAQRLFPNQADNPVIKSKPEILDMIES